MLVLLPPSEGKTPPRRGRPVDLAALSHPELTAAREAVLRALPDGDALLRAPAAQGVGRSTPACSSGASGSPSCRCARAAAC